MPSGNIWNQHQGFPCSATIHLLGALVIALEKMPRFMTSFCPGPIKVHITLLYRNMIWVVNRSSCFWASITHICLKIDYPLSPLRQELYFVKWVTGWCHVTVWALCVKQSMLSPLVGRFFLGLDLTLIWSTIQLWYCKMAGGYLLIFFRILLSKH